MFVSGTETGGPDDMAYNYPSRVATELSDEIVPDSIVIKNIPYYMKLGDLLVFMNQMKLPSPSTLKYLYNGFGTFRGIAFATFASADEARQVVEQLNCYTLSGRMLLVEFKRKRLETVARENEVQKTPSQPDRSCSHLDVRENDVQKTSLQPTPSFSYTDTRENDVQKTPLQPILSSCSRPGVRENEHSRPQAEGSSARRSRREQTPPRESYELLMSYQNEAVEKVKLAKFLARTGDYREAIDAYAMNRVRESFEGGFRTSAEIPPVLGMRPTTGGELEEMVEMESRIDPGGEASSTGALVVKYTEKQDGTRLEEDGLSQGVNTPCPEKKHEASIPGEGAKLGAELDTEEDEKDGAEKGGGKAVM